MSQKSPSLARVAVSANGEGTLTIVKETAAGKFEAVQTVTTRPGARTVAFDEASHSLLLPVGEGRSGGGFELLVVGPAEARK